MGRKTHHFHLAGWRVESEFDLAGLQPWTGEDKLPDIGIRAGAIPEVSGSIAFDGPLLKIASDGSCWFAVPHVASFFVNSPATRVTIDPLSSSSESTITTIMMGTIFGVLCHRRGLLPLHASCVRIGEKAVAFAGSSGAGKSIMAAALMQAGCEVLSDDIAVLDTESSDTPVALPVFPRLSLWKDVVEQLALANTDLSRVRPGIEKYSVPVDHAFASQPTRLAAIYYLRRERRGETDVIHPLKGAAAVRAAATAVYRAGIVPALGPHQRVLMRLTALCAASRSYHFGCQPGFDALAARAAAMVAEHEAAL